MGNDNAEKDLLAELKKAREDLELIKNQLEEAQERYDRAQEKIIGHLEAIGATATGKYPDLGFAQIQKPRLYASCRKENVELLFDFLKSQNRADIIKTGVAPAALSTFAAECIETGVDIPEFINYYLKPVVRLYSA